jgi:hypothetical protein
MGLRFGEEFSCTFIKRTVTPVFLTTRKNKGDEIKTCPHSPLCNGIDCNLKQTFHNTDIDTISQIPLRMMAFPLF